MLGKLTAIAGILACSVPTLSAVTVFTDFGQTDAPANWNSMPNADSGTVADAIDSTGASTGITLTITSRFNGVNSNGTTSGSAPYPSGATDDSFYGNADAVFNGLTITSATIEITGLSAGVPYDFMFFGSRMSAGGDNRETRYTLTGSNSGFAELDVAENITETASVNGITPDGSGMITLVVSEGDDNTNSFGFFYLGAMEINYTPVPEPGSLALFLAGLSFLKLRRRR